ncbi:MAG: hypothetical protein HF312_15375 [Ignavibacteria bacterium]|jgi:phage gpG-like protein|nr:hypothetical protein [Ignavibacteria bacterium]
MPRDRVVILIASDRDDLRRVMNTVRKSIQDLRPVFTDHIRPYMVDNMISAFDSESAPEGGPWAPLNKSYEARRVREGTGTTKLRRWWDMFVSLTSESHPENITDIHKQGMTIGSQDSTAAWNNFGLPNRRTPLPQRQFADITDANVDAIGDMIFDHVIEAI